MLGPPKTRNLDRPVLISLDAYIPKDHFYRYLHRMLDLSFVRNLAADCYASGGRPSIDPEVFFRLQLLMFFAGIRSERQLMEQVGHNLAMRWYAGYNLDEPLPDHSSLSRIRSRLGLPVFRRFFAVIVEQCARAGLVWGEELIFDATKVRANASMDSIKPVLRRVVDDHLTALAETDARDEETRWDLLDECRLAPEHPPTAKGGRKSDFRLSPTDPDAALMKPRGERACLGYHDHCVVDGGKARIILHALVTPGDVMENQPMLDQLRRVMFRWRVRPKRVIVDTTICNACLRKAACTPSEHGRQVHRSFHAVYLDRVRGYHETENYKKTMRKRKIWIEPLFGEAKQWHGMRQFRLRGLQKVNMEGLFIAAGQNLKRLLSAKGWGRRPWPDGATGSPV